MDITVGKGLGVLEHLARSGELVRLSDVAKAMHIHKSNAHRLLNTLVKLGYAHREPETGRYFASLKVWELGALVLDRNAVKRAADPVLADLQRTTSENVSLTILLGEDVLYLSSLVSNMPIRPTVRMGRRVPAIFPASGKAILAHTPNCKKVAEHIIATHPRAKELKIADLMEEFAVIRDRGYAISLGGWTQGINSVAAVVWGRGGKPAAAIAVSGPQERMDRDRLKSLGETVLNACTRMGETGYL
jgi:DNA-binding IclR family transcriptional regulator